MLIFLSVQLKKKNMSTRGEESFNIRPVEHCFQKHIALTYQINGGFHCGLSEFS